LCTTGWGLSKPTSKSLNLNIALLCSPNAVCGDLIKNPKIIFDILFTHCVGNSRVSHPLSRATSGRAEKSKTKATTRAMKTTLQPANSSDYDSTEEENQGTVEIDFQLTTSMPSAEETM
jgi:hypothetical protein